MKRNARKGFTLIEVLLVVTILAMLAAFVVPNLMGANEKAKKGLAAAAIGPSGAIASVLDQFHMDIGRYPTTEEGLQALVIKPSTLEETVADKWGPKPYIRDASGLNDPWGHMYGYKCPGDVNADAYDLWSNGPDGQPNTTDDIRNWKTDNR
jgi:general secretion pathway protein G